MPKKGCSKIVNFDTKQENVAGYLVGRIQTESKAPGTYNQVQLITMIRERCVLLFKVRGEYYHLEKSYRQEMLDTD